MNDADRATVRIFTGVVLATTGVYAAVTVVPVLAEDLTGSAFLAGLPTAALLAGAAAGAAGTARVVRQHGRRVALLGSYTIGALACVLAGAAATWSLFPLLLLAMLAVGAGHAANQLARYAAAELHAPARRAPVIGWIVWAQAVGAVVGPMLVGASGGLAAVVGALPATGPFLAGAVFFALAAGLHLHGPAAPAGAPGPAAPAPAPAGRAPAAGPAPSSPAALVADLEDAGRTGSPWARPQVRVAAAALVTGQVVMLLLMTMTPVHARHGGHALGTVGAIMSAHMLGMYVLAPVAGRFVSRLGALPVIGAGLALLALSGVWAAAVPVHAHAQLAGALFLLGLGWSCGFVAASTMLSEASTAEERAGVQSRAEAVTWGSGAAASVASGLLLGSVGYAALCLLGASLVAVPVLVIVRHRRALVPGGVTS